MKFTFRKNILAIAISSICYNASAAEPEADAIDDIIVITASQKSLLKSLDGKREAQSIMDGISAEELGQFPDANVADSLSHITGISIDRTRGGEGQGVNVRGLGSEFSIVTMNGRLMATDSEGRDFAFDVLPSEMISEAWVHKSVKASTLEGSIGGAINLVTARPLNYKEAQGSINIEGNYSDKSKDTGYKITAVGSNNFADDTMGVIFSVLYSDTPTRTDELSDLNYGTNWDWDHDNDKGWVDWQDSSNLLIIPATFATTAHIEDRKRTAISGAFQFRPNDSVDIVFDALYTRLDSPSQGYTQSYYFPSVTDSWHDVVYEGTPTELNPEGTIVTGMTMDNLTPELVTITDHRVVDTFQLGLNGKFKVTENLSLIGDIYFSSAQRDAGGKNKFVVAHGVGAVPNTATFSLNDNGLPNIAFDFDQSTGIDSISDLVSDDQFGPHYSETAGVDIKDEVQGASLDGKWVLDSVGVSLPFMDLELSSVDFGVVYNKRTKNRDKYDNQHARELYNGAPFTFDQTGVDVVESFPVSDFLSDISGDFPREFVGFNIDAYQEALNAADNNPNVINPDTGEVYPVGYSEDDEARFNPNESFSVEEETLSAYLQANLEGDFWWANLGLRYVSTDTSSNGWLWEIDKIRALSEWNYVIEHKDAQPLSVTNSYSKLLPSINFGYEITENLLVRASYAKVMARASLNQLSTQVDDEAASWGEFSLNNVGNPSLSPVEADQADISIEWYFKEGSAVTAAMFYKDIEGFIQDWQEKYPDAQELRPEYPVQDFGTGEYNNIPFNVFEPKNLDSAKVLGYEIGYQHFFDNGFGLTANYTLIDTESYKDGEKEGVLAGVPDNFYSISFLYGTDTLDLQISASHTQSYIESHWSPLNAEGETTYKSTVDPMTWLTASANYEVIEDMSIYVELDNILAETWHSYQGRSDIPGSYAEWGRKINLGVKYKF